jgi:hypothetical protein
MTTIALRSATSLWRAPSRARNLHTGCPGQPHRVSFDLVTHPAAFETLEPEWDALFATAGRPSQVFQTFAWNWHWCRHYLPPASPGARTQLAIVTGRQHGRLVLVWPLVLERVAGLRRLAWMGDPVSQYGDVLVAAEADDHATFAAAWSFALTATRADFAHLRKVRDDSIAARALAHLNAKVIATEQAPYLDLSSIAGTEACQQLLASKGRRNRRRHERRLADHGPITVHSSSGEAAAQLARDAIDLKRQSLAGKGQISRAFARFPAASPRCGPAATLPPSRSRWTAKAIASFTSPSMSVHSRNSAPGRSYWSARCRRVSRTDLPSSICSRRGTPTRWNLPAPQCRSATMPSRPRCADASTQRLRYPVASAPSGASNACPHRCGATSRR